jgi:dihydrofolate synthase/folylpolyglutamate synthase
MDTKFEHPISFFEAITALAFVAFAEHPVDVGVIEVGMGGLWDATNVVDADVSVIMPIGLDHTEYLGETLTEIAQTKAGIIKEDGFVVLAQQEPECAVELLKQAALVGADVAREELVLGRVTFSSSGWATSHHSGAKEVILRYLHSTSRQTSGIERRCCSGCGRSILGDRRSISKRCAQVLPM